MDTNQCFIANDYLRAFDLKDLFHKHVVYYTHLYHHDGSEPLSSKDRHELALKLEENMNEISLLVLKMKASKQATEATVKETKLPAFHAASRAGNPLPAPVAHAPINTALA